jgi:hypothetical protein
MIGVQPSGKQLPEINQLIAAGKLKTHIATVLRSNSAQARRCPKSRAEPEKSIIREPSRYGDSD